MNFGRAKRQGYGLGQLVTRPSPASWQISGPRSLRPSASAHFRRWAMRIPRTPRPMHQPFCLANVRVGPPSEYLWPQTKQMEASKGPSADLINALEAKRCRHYWALNWPNRTTVSISLQFIWHLKRQHPVRTHKQVSTIISRMKTFCTTRVKFSQMNFLFKLVTKFVLMNAESD